MGQNSKIEWCNHTFNPWIGCAKVSDGCKFCYAETLMDSRWGKVKWGPKGTRQRTSDANWREPFKWNRAAERSGERNRVFCASLADVFEDRKELKPWRSELFSMILQTPHLDWLLLTKRPENSHEMMKDSGFYPSVSDNLWLGTSVENQATADERIPHLLKCPAAVHFLSCEPLLGSVDLANWLVPLPEDDGGAPFPGRLHWVITGGAARSARMIPWVLTYVTQQKTE